MLVRKGVLNLAKFQNGLVYLRTGGFATGVQRVFYVSGFLKILICQLFRVVFLNRSVRVGTENVFQRQL